MTFATFSLIFNHLANATQSRLIALPLRQLRWLAVLALNCNTTLLILACLDRDIGLPPINIDPVGYA